ncbi:hypothetical protein M8J76_012782 [Diaphorina citri]|nr:hypothetical protein M8J76_012782 [Diaphorina citri]
MAGMGTHGSMGGRKNILHPGARATAYTTETDYEAKEALLQRELEEARARAAQMEKTMRWWSDCTANWREKWSKVRNERNKAREELKSQQSKVDAALKEVSNVQREKQELENQNEHMKKELEKIHALLMKHAGQWDQHILDALESVDPLPSVTTDSGLPESCNTSSMMDDEETMKENSADVEEYVLQSSVPRHAVELFHSPNTTASTSSTPRKEAPPTSDDSQSGSSLIEAQLMSLAVSPECSSNETLRHKLSMVQLRLDEATKTLQAEREEKQALHRTIEKLENELTELKSKCEELKTCRQEATRELLTLQDLHEDTVASITADLMDEASTREDMDRRLTELRAQLERLQAENASEWGKRERLETEKLSLERDNKKLRNELRDVMERLEKRGKSQPSADNELRTLQQECNDRGKELAELKHVYGKLKKTLMDRSTELSHCSRRAEQYEAEVKRLRGRVEELKRELAAAEDEIDSATNNNRKLQRSNDELQEQVDSLRVQLEHLNTRLRNRTSNTTTRNDPHSDEDSNSF